MAANDDIRDSMVAHQMFLMRFAKGIQRKVNDSLLENDRELRAMLYERMPRGIADTRRMARLEEQIQDIRGRAFEGVIPFMRQELEAFSVYEAGVIAGFIADAVPVQIDFKQPSAAAYKAIYRDKPFEGLTMREWGKNLEAQDYDRILRQVRTGLVQGQTTQDIVRRVTKQTGSSATKLTRGYASTLVRTALTHYSTEAKQILYDENPGIVEKVQFIATLDSRTSTICASLDGTVYERGKERKPPLHPNCRSVLIPVIGTDIVGRRPFKDFTEKQLRREYEAEYGVDPNTLGHKLKFRDFARKRGRELTGQASGGEAFPSYLRRQSVGFQEDFLGPTRAKLFRDGGLTLDRFVDERGREYTLNELRLKERKAFNKAGI